MEFLKNLIIKRLLDIGEKYINNLFILLINLAFWYIILNLNDLKIKHDSIIDILKILFNIEYANNLNISKMQLY